MSGLPSRDKYRNGFSKNHLTRISRQKYGSYKYQIAVYLNIEGSIPVYTGVKVSTYPTKQPQVPAKKIAILSRYLDKVEEDEIKRKFTDKMPVYTDIKHLGELIFLLAAKLKYDLAKERSPDNAGFLHTDEFEALKTEYISHGNKGPHVGSSVYRTILKFSKAVEKDLKEKLDVSMCSLLDGFLLERNQLHHLICYLGWTEGGNESCFWWLNVSGKDITFINSKNGKRISSSVLNKRLIEFFEKSLLSPDVLPAKVNYAEGYLPEIEEDAQLYPEKKPDSLLKLSMPIIEIDSNNKNQNLFRFEYRWTKFVGRKSEMEKLREFIFYPAKKLLWWVVAGQGGVGKSRLALELCIELEKERWHTGFLTDSKQLDSLQDWRPSRSTLIVVDYTSDKTEHLGKFISNIYPNSISWEFSVRILFLERCSGSGELDKFICQNYEIIENNLRYNVFNSAEPLSLELCGLGDTDAQKVIKELFSKSNVEFLEKDIVAIGSFLKSKEIENKPLYIISAIDIYAKGDGVLAWSKETLLKEILEHNIRTWKGSGISEDSKTDRKHINLLALATMVGGIEIDDTYRIRQNFEEFGEFLPDMSEISEKKYGLMSDNKIDSKFWPMTPDIFGEYFVLDFFKKGLVRKHQIQTLSKMAWKCKPAYFEAFVFRASMDYPLNETLNNIIETIIASDDFPLEKATLLFNLTYVYGRDGNYERVILYCKYLEELYSQNPENEKIAEILAKAFFELTCDYAKLDKPRMIKEYCDKIKVILQKFDSTEIKRQLAKSGFNLITCYCKSMNIKKATKAYDEIIDICDIQKDKVIAGELIRAGTNLIYCFETKGSIAKMIKYFEIVRTLGQDHLSNQDAVYELAKAAFNMMLHYFKTSNLDQAKQYLDFIENFWQLHQSDIEITETFARSLIVYSRMCHNDDKQEQARKYKQQSDALLKNAGLDIEYQF